MPQILNDNEKDVLKEIRNRNINEIFITKKGTHITKIEASTGGVITGEQAKEVRRVLGLRNYEEIKICTRDEKTLIFKSTKKKINSD
jgi:bifunctional DNA-binding transcriptional regulator/antitoxin component of YhaV-PrlF toxin-antitoxin module